MEEKKITLGNSKRIIDEANIFFIEELMVINKMKPIKLNLELKEIF